MTRKVRSIAAHALTGRSLRRIVMMEQCTAIRYIRATLCAAKIGGDRTMLALPKNPSEIFDLRGRTAIVTGATGAFGEIAATVLGRAGCKLVIAAASREKLDVLAKTLGAEGIAVRAVPVRPDSEAACDRLVEVARETFGGLDILVVGSGMNDVSLIEEQSLERWQAVMDANVTGSWLMCRAAGRLMKTQGRGGKVVLVSSARSILGHPAGYSAYCPSKSAVDGLVRALGCEWGREGINVNAIAPTVFRSPLTAWMFGDDERARTTRANFLQRLPLGRLGEPADLAGPLLFLCCAASDFMTGQIIRPDGGYTAG